MRQKGTEGRGVRAVVGGESMTRRVGIAGMEGMMIERGRRDHGMERATKRRSITTETEMVGGGGIALGPGHEPETNIGHLGIHVTVSLLQRDKDDTEAAVEAH